MKKILISMTLLAGFSLPAVAQDDTREALHFGLKAGINYSNVYDEEDEDFDADGQVGFAGGAFLSIPIGRFLGVQPEILYSQKGFRGSGTVLGTSYAYSRTLNYIDIPLQVMLKPAPGFTILLGPQYSFLVSSKDVFTIGSSSSVDEDVYDNDNIRRNTLCVVGGFDFTFASHFVFAPRFGIDLLYNNGDGTQSDIRYKNNWLQLTLGYQF